MYDLTVVVPTFNEKDNVRPLYELLTRALGERSWEVVFVDDDSPDDTAGEARGLASTKNNIRIIQRKGRRGLAGACIEGILSSTSPYCAVIDADLQHDETKLPAMLDMLTEDRSLDLVVASRNINGGSAGEGLSRWRKWGSDYATLLVNRALRVKISDPMSGFFMVRRQAFNEVVVSLQSEGFKVLADMIAASNSRWKIREIPYTFRQRRAGESKMGAAVVLEFLALLLARMTGGLVSIRFVLFVAVGLTGVFVQLAGVKFFLTFFDDSFIGGQMFGVVAAIASNFFLNNAITFRDRALRGTKLLRGLVIFYGVCSVGAVVNVAVAELFYSYAPFWVVASLLGAVMGAFWNFLASSLFTWRVA